MTDSDLTREIEQIVARYPLRRSALLPALHLAQTIHGYLSREVMEQVARILRIPSIQVYEVATFYDHFSIYPLGKYRIQLCTNVSCMLCGAQELLEYLQQQLSIKAGETSLDNRYTLEAVECLGACELAPVLQVNNQPYCERVCRQNIDALLAQIQQQNPNIPELIKVINV